MNRNAYGDNEYQDFDEGWVYLRAREDLIEQIVDETQEQDMTLSEFLKMCHEEYTANSN